MLTATRSGKVNISKEKDTKLIAEKICKLIKLGDFILLSGNLGVGKTTFVKYIINSHQKINSLRISEVPSPTFNITNGTFSIDYNSELTGSITYPFQLSINVDGQVMAYNGSFVISDITATTATSKLYAVDDGREVGKIEMLEHGTYSVYGFDSDGAYELIAAYSE